SARPPAQTIATAAIVESGRKAQKSRKPADAVEELKAAAAKNPRDARAQEDLAVVLSWRRPDDEAERLPLHAMERALDAAPTDAQMALRLARLDDRDANKRRAAIDRALAAHPEDSALLDALASYRLDRGEGWAALELARKARAAAPQSIDPMLTEARALDGVGLSARASLLRIETAKVRPDLARARRAAAGAYRRLGRSEDAAAELKQALALRFDDAEARGDLVSLALDRGALNDALTLSGETRA